jgi:hypothetical protein
MATKNTRRDVLQKYSDYVSRNPSHTLHEETTSGLGLNTDYCGVLSVHSTLLVRANV